FPAAARSIDDKSWNSKARGVAPQAFYYLNALGHAGAEVFNALREVALIDIVWPHSVLYQGMHQGLHYPQAIIYSPQQHRLISQGNAGIGQSGQSHSRIFGNFPRMVKMSV